MMVVAAVGGCDDSGAVDESVPQKSLAVLPRSYDLQVEVLWSECDLEGWRLIDGEATAVVSQADSLVSWNQTSRGEGGETRPGAAWALEGALCPATPGEESDDATGPPAVPDGGASPAGGDGGVELAPYLLRLSGRVVQRPSFGESVCQVVLEIPKGTEGNNCEGTGCRACDRPDAFEFLVDPCTCAVSVETLEVQLVFREACEALPNCTIGLRVTGEGARTGCIVRDEALCPPD